MNPFSGSKFGKLAQPIYGFFTDLSDDKKAMNSQICGFLINKISENYQDP